MTSEIDSSQHGPIGQSLTKRQIVVEISGISQIWRGSKWPSSCDFRLDYDIHVRQKVSHVLDQIENLRFIEVNRNRLEIKILAI